MDTVDEARDKLISEHIMNIHNRKSNGSGLSGYTNSQTEDVNSQNSMDDDTLTLTQRLRKRCRHVDGMLHGSSSSGDSASLGSGFSLLPSELFRKYIEYAKVYSHPKLTPSAAKILQKFYLTRKSEALIGLYNNYVL